MSASRNTPRVQNVEYSGMTAASPLLLLARYTAWANAVLFDTLAELPQSVLEALQKIVFGSILGTLNHVYAMDLVWQANLQGRAHGFTTRNPQICPEFEPLRRAQAAVNDGFADTSAP